MTTAATPAGRRRYLRRLALPLALAPLLAIALALLDGGILPLLLPASPLAPGAGPPVPAAEALGREFLREWRLVRNASEVDDEQLGGEDEAGPCEIDLSLSGRNNLRNERRGIEKDYFCYSYTDRAIVTLTATAANIPYRAYLTSGQQADGAQAWHAGVKVIDQPPRNKAPRQYGRTGVAEYNGVLQSDPAHADHTRRIVITGDMASPRTMTGGSYHPHTNNGSAFLIVYGGAPNGELADHPSKVVGTGLDDLTPDRDVIIKIYFLQEFDPGVTWFFIPGVEQKDDGSRTANNWLSSGPTPRISSSGNYHPYPGGAPRPTWYRLLRLTDRWLTDDINNETRTAQSGIRYCIQPRDYANAGYWHPQAEVSARLVFAPGSNLSGASGSYEETIPVQHHIAASAGCDYRYLAGFNPAGPVRAEWQVSVDDGQGTIHNLEPHTIVIEGPPASLRLTRAPTVRLNGGIRYVQLHYSLTDGLGSVLTGRRDRIRWRGADEATRNIIDRNGGGGTASGGRFIFPVKADAPAGRYTLELTAGAVSREVSFTVHPLPTTAEEMMPTGITASAVAGGVAGPGGRVNFRYTLHDRTGNLLPLNAFPVTWSVDASGVVDQAGSVDGAQQSDGRFGFDIASNPAPGVYTVTIRTVATGDDGQPLASQTITFRIIGNPARYAVAGPDQVAPGGYAVYTVTATDAGGNLPNLAGAYGRVAISVRDAAGDDASDAVRLFNTDDGSLTLNRQGVGRFRLRADYDAPAVRLTITAAGPDGAITGTRTVAIGAAP